MSKEIKTQIVIKATPQKIWNILTDFEKYSQWNPFIQTITGEAEIGKKLKVHITPPGGKAMNFVPKVVEFDTNNVFCWQGHLLFPGLFDGRHRFQILDNGNGTCTFIHSEKFGGILVPLFTSMLDNETTNGFNLMNEKLKELAER